MLIPPQAMKSTPYPVSTNFNIPNYSDSNAINRVEVICNLSSSELVVGNPVNISVVLKVRTSIYSITDIHAWIHNAKEYPPVIWDFDLGTLKDSYIQMTNEYNTTLYQTWIGNGSARFEAPGKLKMDIVFVLFPLNTNEWGEYEQRFPNHQFSEMVEFNSIYIESEQSIQQRRNEQTNLAISWVVLFFAFVELAVVFYNHSEDKDRKAEYERRKAMRKRRDMNYPEQELAY